MMTVGTGDTIVAIETRIGPIIMGDIEDIIVTEDLTGMTIGDITSGIRTAIGPGPDAAARLGHLQLGCAVALLSGSSGEALGLTGGADGLAMLYNCSPSAPNLVNYRP